MDIIFIKGLTVATVIGIYNWERVCLQKLVFDMDIAYNKVSTSIDICKNSIISYLDYEKVSDFVSKLVSENCFFLLESVAEIVASELMLYFDIPWIRVNVTKLRLNSKNFHVGVMIERGCMNTR